MNTTAVQAHLPSAPVVEHPSPAKRAAGWLLARWPAVIALALTVPGGSGTDAFGFADTLGNALLMLPLAYLILAKLQRRAFTWPVVFAVVGLVVAARTLGVSPAVVLAGLALVVLVWSLSDHGLRHDTTFRTQVVGLAGFGAITVAGLVMLAVDPVIGTVLVAAGWFLHGVWDFVHLRLDAVVARSFAEWCGVVDMVLAIQLVMML